MNDEHGDRDPVERVRVYLAAAEAVGLPLRECHLLFPKIARGPDRADVWGLQNPMPKSYFDFQHAST